MFFLPQFHASVMPTQSQSIEAIVNAATQAPKCNHVRSIAGMTNTCTRDPGHTGLHVSAADEGGHNYRVSGWWQP